MIYVRGVTGQICLLHFRMLPRRLSIFDEYLEGSDILSPLNDNFERSRPVQFLFLLSLLPSPSFVSDDTFDIPSCMGDVEPSLQARVDKNLAHSRRAPDKVCIVCY